MHYLVIDLTHGGVKIAISLAKEGKIVYAYDIYNTLSPIDREMMGIYDIHIIDLDYLANLKGDITVISPIHCPLTEDEIIECNRDLKYTFLTHHQAIREILKGWGEDILKIEVTGVKGKTSCVFMLKEILLNENPLILSSLGARLYENDKEFILKKDISITPANIKETIDLAYKIANPICQIADGTVKSPNLRKYSSAIFESSLGVSGVGDVGLLTNVVENYPIAKNKSTAAEAKKQVFRCPIVVCDKESLDKYYSNVDHPKINSFSLTDDTSNLYTENINYSIDLTEIDIKYRDVKTISGKSLNGKISIKTFAPGPHHVLNVLGVVLTALSLDINHTKITNGLANFKGITGRTNKRSNGNLIVIEEINPGINTKAIRQSIEMIENIDEYYISVGGDYGITCEEIDEDKVSKYLDEIECNIILTGDVGYSILNKMSKKVPYLKDYNQIYDMALKDNKNLLFIYRSNYSKVSQR